MKHLIALSALAWTTAAAFAQPLLVLNKDGTLAIVDPASKKVVGAVRTGDGPHEVETDGKLAYVSNYGSSSPGSTLSVIDLAARKEIHRVDLGPLRRPHGLFVADGKCYFTAEVNKLIGRYDPVTNQVDMLLGTGQNTTHMVMLNKERTQIYTSNISSDTISIFDTAGVNNWNQTVVPVGKGPEGFDVTPDGKQLWAAGSQDGSITILDVGTKRVLSSFSIKTKRSNRLKFTPDGRLVLVSDLDAGELVVLERETKKTVKRIPVGRGLAGVLVTPDSKTAYAAATGDNNVGVIDLTKLEL